VHQVLSGSPALVRSLTARKQMSRHKNFKQAKTRSAPPLLARERERSERAALDELLRHGGNADDVSKLQQHFKEAAAAESYKSEIPE
jgi:hypothetical protein